jgi:FixJ family two-component response regulator
MIPLLYIVEDDPAVRDSLVAVFQANGFVVTAFATGTAFLDAIGGGAGKVLILDLQLPDLRGDQVMAALKSRGIGLKIIVISGGASDAAKLRANELGAIAVFDKPVHSKRLLELIRSIA